MSPNIPTVSELLENPSLRSLVERINHSTLASTARAVLEELRSEAQTVASERTLPDVSELADRIAKRIMENAPTRMRSVVNATGVLFHAELGKPPLAESAAEAMVAAARGYVDDPRPSLGVKHVCREVAVEQMLRDLTSAERSIVLNSMAGATTLAIAALCRESELGDYGELVAARGHLVDFDGEYRLADLAGSIGPWLTEIGASNRVRLDDYTRAIDKDTAAVLWVEDSRHVPQDYSSNPTLKEVVAAAHAQKVPVIAHLDGGTLLDDDLLGVATAASVPQAVAAGADVVIFRGDRFLGGPQCGLIAGRRAALERIEHHPLADALHIDGPTSAALAATLHLYADAEKAKRGIPLLQLLSTSTDNLKNRAERIATQLAACDVVQSAEVTEGVTQLSDYGCGCASDKIPTWRIEIEPAHVDGQPKNAEQLAAELLEGEPGVVARIEGDRLVIDLRSVIPWQDIELVTAFEAMDADEDEEEE
ncbi:MAG: L-seryl-tRNA(Sec) selenium transferase [Planctomycetota bacterium]|nr:L-seryl-tRNA(Sec) selenium transferase [Planctomycetota bacterium]